MKDILMESPVFAMAAYQFDRVADFLQLDSFVRERCKWPKRVIAVSVPVKRDNGGIEMFSGYRVQHHLSRGPVKGGLRYHPQVDVGEVAALAMWMNWKCALLKLPFGGGKGGVTCDPTALSIGEKERLTRRFTMEMIPFIGPKVDVMAPDMGTDAQVMAWMVDTYSTHVGHLEPGIVTGKPIHLQGSLGRRESTGHGVAFLAMSALEQVGVRVANATAVIQGFGNVGVFAARTLAHYGCRVIAVSDLSGALFNSNGIAVDELIDYVARNGVVAGFPGGEEFDAGTIFGLECDILIPAAIERVIDENNAADLKCKVLAEAANGPTTPGADAILEERGDVFVVPDILCNGGGVTVSYFEWVQSRQHFFWNYREVMEKLEVLLSESFRRVVKFAKKEKIPMRVAALALGICEVANTKKTRGLFP